MKKKNEGEKTSTSKSGIPNKIKVLMNRVVANSKKIEDSQIKHCILWDNEHKFAELRGQLFTGTVLASKFLEKIPWTFMDSALSSINSIRGPVPSDLREIVDFIWGHDENYMPNFVQLNKNISLYASGSNNSSPTHFGIESTDYKKLAAFIEEHNLVVKGNMLGRKIESLKTELAYYETFNEICSKPEEKSKDGKSKKGSKKSKTKTKTKTKAKKTSGKTKTQDKVEIKEVFNKRC
jgi:hypothetical protein